MNATTLGAIRAFSYIRFSSKKQAKGSSLGRQVEKTRSYCAANGLFLDERLSFQDLGVSAKAGGNQDDRRGLGKLMAACEAGLIPPGSAIVVESLDRISRQRPRIVATLLGRFLDHFRVEVHLTGINKVLRPDVATAAEEGMDLIYIAMLASRAAEENETKADRLRAAFARKRKAVAEGARLLEVHPGKLPWWVTVSEDGKSLKSPPERAEVVRSIFQWTADGLTAPQIARRLQAAGIPTWRPKTKDWQSARVRGLVVSRAPEGLLQQTAKSTKAGMAYEIPDYYPTIVDAQLAARARLALKANKTKKAGRPHELRTENERPVNILRSLLRVDGHWAKFDCRPNGPGGELNGYYVVYIEAEQRCPASIPAKLIEPTLLAGLVELDAADLLPVERADDPYAARLALIESELASVEKALLTLAIKVEENPDLDTLIQRLRQREDERSRLKEEIVSLSLKIAMRPDAKAGVSGLKELRSLRDADFRDNDSRRRLAECLTALVDRIDFSYVPTAGKSVSFQALFAGRGMFVPDPVTASKRRKALSMVVHFRDGGRRAIIRLDPLAMARVGQPNTIFSGRP